MIHEPPPVRLATSDDVEGIMALCWAAHEERNERSPSGEKARSMVTHCLDGNGAIGVIDIAGDLRAMCGLVIHSPWCSEDKELYDWLVYVRTDCRRMRYLSPLLKFAKETSIRMGLPLWMGWIGDSRSEAKSRAYERHFSHYGAFYRFDPRVI